jgi:serine/threonine protein kinase
VLEALDICRTRHPHTLRYAAPEVLEGEPVNDRSDVYAYGMLLYEIFSGNVRSFSLADGCSQLPITLSPRTTDALQALRESIG